MKDCPNKERNAQGCPCTSESCARRGVCCECIQHHGSRGQKPACMK